MLYVSKYYRTTVASHPGMRGLRFSMSDYREQDWLINVPLYAVVTCFENNIPLIVKQS